MYADQVAAPKGWPDVHSTMENTRFRPGQHRAEGTDMMQRRGSNIINLLVTDYSTRVSERSDLRALLSGTMPSATRVDFDVAPTQLLPLTRMARIRQLANLSLREWAGVFGVTHTAIKQWLSTEPGRDKLNLVGEALEEAARYHADLGRWLRRPLPGTDVPPLDLLRRESWRAFRGALRAGAAPDVTISREELRRCRQTDESWAVPEAPAAGAD